MATTPKTTETVTVNGIEYIRKDSVKNTSIKEVKIDGKKSPYKIGQGYFIRTVTMAYTGIVTDITNTELVLNECSWIADTGRFNEALKDSSKINEIEPMGDGIIIGRGAVVDASPLNYKMPLNVK